MDYGKTVELDEHLNWCSRLTEGQYFQNLTDEDQLRLKNQVLELQKERNEAQKNFKASMDKLFETGPWPIQDALSTGFEDYKDTADKPLTPREDLTRYILELEDASLQMRNALSHIPLFSTPETPLFLPDDSDSEDHDAPGPMDIDTISKNLDGRSAPSMPTQEELERFQEQLAHMEGVTSTLLNDIKERHTQEGKEIEQLVDIRLASEEFQDSREDAETHVTGEQVGELASEIENQEIEDLIMRVNELESGIAASRKERQESMGKVLEAGSSFLCLLLPSPDVFIFFVLFIDGTTYTRIHLDTRTKRSHHPKLRKGFERLHIPAASFSTSNSTKPTTL